MPHPIPRRALLGTATAALGLTAPARGQRRGTVSVTSAVYPGAWEEAFREHVAPPLKRAHNVELELQPLFAVDQVAKFAASRGVPPFDCFVLDPGPRITAIERGMFERFDAAKLGNRAQLPPGAADEWGVGCAAQVVGIAYNPKKVPKPGGYADLLRDPWVSRLGITGFGTTFGTISLIEMAKVFGGSETTSSRPCGAEEALPKIAAVGAPPAMPGLFQQGQCDVMYTNTQTVTTPARPRRGHRVRRALHRRQHLLHHAPHRQGQRERGGRLSLHRHGGEPAGAGGADGRARSTSCR
jgi:putative spermidine/putrescine transport system substrate-binding protein